MLISIVTLQQEGPDIWPGPFCVEFRCLQGSLWVLWLLPIVKLLGLGGSKYAMGAYVTVSVPPCVSCDRLAICGSWDGLQPPCDSDTQKKTDGYGYLI